MTLSEALSPKIDWDLVDGAVTIHGRTIDAAMLSPVLQEALSGEGPTFALLEVKKGDRFPADIGFRYDGLAVAPPPTTLKFGLKEFDTGRLVSLSDGTSLKITRDGAVRFRIFSEFEAVAMQRILAKYVDLSGTYVDVLCELEGTWDYDEETAPDSFAASTIVSLGAVTASPVVLPLEVEQEEASVDYELRVVASIDGTLAERQTASVTRDVTLTKSGGGFSALPLNAVTTWPDPDYREDVQLVPAKLDAMTVVEVTEDAEVSLHLTTEAFDNADMAYPAGNIWIARMSFPPVFSGVYRSVQWGQISTYDGKAIADGAAETLSFVDGGGAIVGTLTIPQAPTGLLLASPHAVNGDDVYVMGGRSGNFRELEIIWLSDPGIAKVTAAGRPDALVQMEAAPQVQSFSVEATLSRKDASGDPVARFVRKSTQTFIMRLRRDLIPDVAPDPGGS